MLVQELPAPLLLCIEVISPKAYDTTESTVYKEYITGSVVTKLYHSHCFCHREERAVWRGANPLLTAQITSMRLKSGAVTTPVRPGLFS